MVSGFLTSPCDQLRTSSAVARPIRSSSKTLTSSNFPTSFGGSPCGTKSGRYAPGAGVLGRRARGSDLFDAARVGTTGQVDTELFGGAVDLLIAVAHLDGGAVGVEHLHVQAQGLHLLDQHLERFRDARFGDVLTLDDGLVDLHAA